MPTNPLDLLFRQGLDAEMFNRFKLGRTLDEVYTYGCDLLKDMPSPRYLVADAKLYCEDHAVDLSKLGFLTRIPATLKLVSQVIGQALQWDTWQPLDDTTRYQPLELGHYGMAQRWLVV